MSKRDTRRIHLEILDVADFDVSRYDGCKDLNAAGWHALLQLRWLIKARLLGPEKRSKAMELGEVDRGLHLLGQILARPLGNVDRNVAPIGVPFRYKAISDVDLYSIWRGRELFEKMPEAQEACEQLDEVLFTTSEPHPPLTHESLHSHLLKKGVWSGRHYEAQVFVDLHATDDQIKRQFAEWLALKRIELKAVGLGVPPTRISAAYLRKLHEQRVLPYIDINLLAYHLGLDLSYDQIADKLFPDDRSGGMGDFVRRTVKSTAEEAMQSDMLSALEWQGGEEYWHTKTQ